MSSAKTSGGLPDVLASSSATSCKRFFSAANQYKAAAFLVEQSSDRSSDSAARAGNESDFIGKLEIHDVSERI
jgi:hypothetical protein